MIVILIIKRMKDLNSSWCKHALSLNIFTDMNISSLFFSYQISKINSLWHFLFIIFGSVLVGFPCFGLFLFFLGSLDLLSSLFKVFKKIIFLLGSLIIELVYFYKRLDINLTRYCIWNRDADSLLFLGLNVFWHLYALK